jgi:hypothetical protein
VLLSHSTTPLTANQWRGFFAAWLGWAPDGMRAGIGIGGESAMLVAAVRRGQRKYGRSWEEAPRRAG